MKTMSAREAKNSFGLMIDTARAEPATYPLYIFYHPESTCVAARAAGYPAVAGVVDVGVLGLVVPHHRIDHRLRLLARRGIVEVHQRLAVHRLPQQRKMVAAAGDPEQLVELFRQCRGFGCCHDRAMETRPARSR